MNMSEELPPEKVKEIMKMADRRDAKSDTWDTLMGLMIVGACIFAFAGGCVYAHNRFCNNGQSISKQGKGPALSIKTNQVER